MFYEPASGYDRYVFVEKSNLKSNWTASGCSESMRAWPLKECAGSVGAKTVRPEIIFNIDQNVPKVTQKI
jgi:hypothetical protein